MGLQKIGKVISLLVIVIAVNSCIMEHPKDDSGKFKRPDIGIDLPEILQKGKLTILVENSSTSYFIYKGKKMGFEYELLNLFAEEIGVELEVVVVNNLDSLISMLNRGEGDLIACNYTVTRERNKVISFSEPFLHARQVLVQRKPDGWEDMKKKEWMSMVLTNPEQLAKKSIQVWQNSSYYQRLMHLQEEIGDSIYMEGVEGDVGTEELIEMVADGIIDYTITEENVAKVNEQFFDNIYTGLELSVKQKMAFGLRKSSHLLKVRIDKWLTDFKNKSTYRYISRKYFEMRHVAQSRVDYTRLNKTSISPFDEFFKKAEELSGWDWRLIAALSYQESKFNPNALSFGGAYGMMQFMPNTGPQYGVFPDSPPEVQIMGAARKLMADEAYWKAVPDISQRKKFAMASYNAGRGHILDAQRLAKKYGLNHLVWDDSVEKMLLNLSKKEYYQDELVRHGMIKSRTTYNYVRQVTERFMEWAAVYH